MPLTELKIKALKPKEKLYRVADGDCLYLEVNPKGGKYWRMNFRIEGKRDQLTFGPYPRVSLKEARILRNDARKLITQGVNPADVKRREKVMKAISKENDFESIAREWHSQNHHKWSEAHAKTILTRLEANIFPAIGHLPIRDIRAPEVLSAVRVLEAKGNRDLAHRQLQHCGQIFRYAIATDRAEFDVTMNLKGALQPVKSSNYAHLKESQLPKFLKELNQYESKYNGNPLTKLGFQLLILTFLRPGEIRGAEWSEIDFEKKQWRIPSERMKMDAPHIIPLCIQSLTVLKKLYAISGESYSGYVFPSMSNPRKTMSDGTFLRAIKNMGYRGETTAHGFRHTASTILNENSFNRDWIEAQLSHGERDQVRAAYNHAEYLPQRAEMMQWWGDYLEKAGMEIS